jgi:hypothetical protein
MSTVKLGLLTIGFSWLFADGVAENAEALDFQFDDIAGLKPRAIAFGEFEQATCTNRTTADDIAGLQNDILRSAFDHLAE